MSDKKYIVGIDYGMLSGCAIVVDAATGEQLGTHVIEYPHGVMDRTLTASDNQTLPPEFALQNPADHVKVLRESVLAAVKDAEVDPVDIVGIGVGATSATVFFTDEDGVSLCEKPGFENNVHVYVKLRKHHGAQDQATRLVRVAEARREEWLGRYGGVLPSELLLPKVLEVFETAPEVYKEANVVCNLLDWPTWKLTGTLTQSAGDPGYKCVLQDRKYPSFEYLEAVRPGFGHVFEEKVSASVLPLGAKVGGLTKEMAELTGLSEDIAAASGNIDAHVVVVGANAVRPGQFIAILGTSSCYVLNGEEYRDCPGVLGIVDGGAMDGCWGFEGGQTAVGDIFAWFVDNCVPGSYVEKAKSRGVSIHDLLVEKSKGQEIGEHGLVAPDWHNGSHLILADVRLSDLIVGQTLTTASEDVYRALPEATAFGCRVIIDNFEEHGIKVDGIVVAGGLLKNSYYIQMLSDITCRPIPVLTAKQTGALGSAVFVAVAAGVYPNVFAAADTISSVEKHTYEPNLEASARYDEVYEIYKELHDSSGRYNGVSPMHRLKDIRARIYHDGDAEQ